MMDPVAQALALEEQARSWCRGASGADPGPSVLADEVRRQAAEIAALQATVKRLEADNAAADAEDRRFRAGVGMSANPCIYCRLPADEIAKCRSGFPGCARMDDRMGCPEFGAMLELHQANKEIAALHEELARVATAVVAEREACALTAETANLVLPAGGWHSQDARDVAAEAARRIRARSSPPYDWVRW